MKSKGQFTFDKGVPYPYGVNIQGDKLNFSIFSKTAQMTLCLFDRESGSLSLEIPLSPENNRTGYIWHISIGSLAAQKERFSYAYRTDNKIVALDPYAREVNSPIEWGEKKNHFLQGKIVESSFDFGDDHPPGIPLNALIIYEMHIRGFTQDESSQTAHPGKFLGVIEKIPHLIELGVNAVKFLPIQEFNECEYAKVSPLTKKNLYNYWGYSTVNFFSPMNRYASSTNPGAAIDEFKAMVKELHRNGIEVILDVVFNHTAEGNDKGPVLSFKGFDAKSYYLINANGQYMDYTGCGNTFNANYPVAIELIIDALRYWVSEMHVDGFRFDLASALTRGTNGESMKLSPLIQSITEDPLLARVKLIAEPWDAAGLYQVGSFAPETKRWSEWNGKYRDAIRRFIKGDHWSVGEFARRICGSEDLYHARSPLSSINFVTAHDGFTLADLVSFNKKHNLGNGENNADGMNENECWNCGIEGRTTNKKITALRERQMRNFHLALMISLGVPMILMGDEYGHTKEGNNNTWCQDNALNWFLWNKLNEHSAFFRFYKLMIQFRKRHPIFSRNTYLTNRDIEWHGKEPFKPDWNSEFPFIAFTMKNPDNNRDIYIAFNAQDIAVTIHFPPAPQFKHWRWIVNTSNPSPEDFYENGNGPLQINNYYKMCSHSAIILKAV